MVNSLILSFFSDFSSWRSTGGNRMIRSIQTSLSLSYQLYLMMVPSHAICSLQQVWGLPQSLCRVPDTALAEVWPGAILVSCPHHLNWIFSIQKSSSSTLRCSDCWAVEKNIYISAVIALWHALEFFAAECEAIRLEWKLELLSL